MKMILIGVISGIVTGLGMGGGSVLILLLTIWLGIEQHTAQASNLVFFIPTAISAIFFHFKNKNVNTVIGEKLLFPIMIGTIFGTYLTQFTDSTSLRKYYGFFLLGIAVWGIWQQLNRKDKVMREEKRK